jgi:hypothetical protein
MSYFYTSARCHETFLRTLSLMRGNWERGLCTTLHTSEFSFVR